MGLLIALRPTLALLLQPLQLRTGQGSPAVAPPLAAAAVRSAGAVASSGCAGPGRASVWA